MVDFNDRRLTEAQRGLNYVRPDIQMAVDKHLKEGSDRRVRLEFNGPEDENGIAAFDKSGYLRADESGAPRLYHNSRSTKGSEIPLGDLRSISSSRRDKTFVDDDGVKGSKVHTSYWSRWGSAYSIPGEK